MEYALFGLMWLAVALLAVLGLRIAYGIVFDLRERTTFHLPQLLRRR
jgi:hypothetical protein